MAKRSLPQGLLLETLCLYQLWHKDFFLRRNFAILRQKSFISGLKRLTLMKNFVVTKNCNGCGVCTSVCPMDNIKIKNNRAIHGHECAACYACLHWCPQNATLLNVPTLKHRTQYHHPEISIHDLVQDFKWAIYLFFSAVTSFQVGSSLHPA